MSLTCDHDASAMIAYLRDEAGAAVVAAVLSDPNYHCVAHAMNLCEVYYDVHRAAGVEKARQAILDLAELGVETDSILTPEFWQKAGELKANRRRVSLADCIAITLAQSLDAEVLTADHHEFDILQEQAVCRIRFIR